MTKIPPDVIRKIHEQARTEWPDDPGMQEYTIEEEKKAFAKIQDVLLKAVPERIAFDILAQAEQESALYEEQAYFIEDEIEAYRKVCDYDATGIPSEVWEQIQADAMRECALYSCREEFISSQVRSYRYLHSFRVDDVPLAKVAQLISEAQNKYPDDYCAQQNYLDSGIRVHRIRKVVDPIKPLLIELEEIIGNECYNDYIQNYGPWGAWEDQGRTFRYPVVLTDEDLQSQKRWQLTNAIPSEDLITGHYLFGANQLFIFNALVKVIRHIEKKYGISLASES